MNYNFSDRVRRALMIARDEAVRLRHDYVGTEHLLLGMLGLEDSVGGRVLAERGLSLALVGERIEGAVRPGKRYVSRGELPYTSRAKKVLEFAMASARSLGDDYVGTEHLLLGLLREERGIAAVVLRGFGMDDEGVRESLRRVRSGAAAPSAPVAPDEGPGFAVRIDDESSQSIYEQIIAQVQEAVATGALQPGDRLAPVRRLADQLDIAPGTVARAYGELERLGVVVTEGARGTRIAEPSAEAPAEERRDALAGLLRPVAVAAFHMGAGAAELRAALDAAMTGILGEDDGQARSA